MCLFLCRCEGFEYYAVEAEAVREPVQPGSPALCVKAQRPRLAAPRKRIAGHGRGANQEYVGREGISLKEEKKRKKSS